MTTLASHGEGECLVALGLAMALKYVEDQGRQASGHDLGIIYVEAWCRRQWRRVQRQCRVEHLFGKRQYSQFPTSQFGIWSEAERETNFELDLVVGKFESGSENLDFICWTCLQPVSEAGLKLFEILDPNSPRFDNDVILNLAQEILPPSPLRNDSPRNDAMHRVASETAI